MKRFEKYISDPSFCWSNAIILFFESLYCMTSLMTHSCNTDILVLSSSLLLLSSVLTRPHSCFLNTPNTSNPSKCYSNFHPPFRWLWLDSCSSSCQCNGVHSLVNIQQSFNHQEGDMSINEGGGGCLCSSRMKWQASWKKCWESISA